jgi:glycosyltransferase involved in cell wall biosynthesis
MQHTYCIFSAHFPPHMGGIESYTESLANQLSAMGNTAIVVTSRLQQDTPARETLANGVEVFRLPCHPLMKGRLPIAAHNGEHKRMLRELAAQKPDRVIVNARFYPHSLDGVRFANQMNIPVFVVDHGSAYLTLNNATADVLIRRWEHAYTARLQKYPVHFAAVSEKSAAWLKTFGVTAEALFPNAIDPSSLENALRAESEHDYLEPLLDAKQGGDNKLIVAYVGRYIPEKGIPSLLEAASALREEPILFAFAGSGALDSAINAQNGLANIVNLGRLPRAEVLTFLAESDVLCLPSRSEGFSTTLLETAAAGCMPISTDVGGAREIGLVPDTSASGNTIAEHGVLLKDSSPSSIEEALLWALDHPAERLEKSIKLSQFVREHNTWTQTVQAIDVAFSAVGQAGRQLP